MQCADRSKFVLLVSSLLLVGLLTGCKGDSAAASTKGPGGRGGRGDIATPVTIGHAVQRNVPVQAEVIGSVEASAMVSLKPQISGQIIQTYFHEGDFVKTGQLLATIDPRALEAQLNQLQAQIAKDKAAVAQAEAALARDRAQEANAKTQLERATELSKQGIISKEQYDQYVTTVATFAATINADLAAIENSKAQIIASQAAVETQKVQLGYTKLFAPITGRTGSITVKPGNIVTANTTELATINQVQPVYVTFSLPEVNLAALRQHAGLNMPVTAIPEEGGTQQAGKVAFFENNVDATTGTVKVKAAFDNKDRVLWPGQFVRVTLKLGDHPNAILVPTQAVQSGQDGTFVYVVKGDQKVELHPVVTSARLGDETVVDRGVNVGDTVVTEGTLRLVPGARVAVRERPAGGGRGGPGGMRGAGGGSPDGGGGGRPDGAPAGADSGAGGRPAGAGADAEAGGSGRPSGAAAADGSGAPQGGPGRSGHKKGGKPTS